MSLKFIKDKEYLFCEYRPEDGIEYIISKIRNQDTYRVKNIFTISRGGYYIIGDDEAIKFEIGSLAKDDDDYYLLDNKVFNFNNRIYIHKDMKVSNKVFIAPRNINLLSRIDDMSSEDIYIGGEVDTGGDSILKNGVIPESYFWQFVEKFPTTYEMNRYAESRIDGLLQEYINSKKDYIGNYNSYIDKKKNRINKTAKEAQSERVIYENELEKYTYYKTELTRMLDEEARYSERQWQEKVANIILMLFPKYIAYLREGAITTVGSDRRVDFVLVDTNGYIDIVEIKKSQGINIISKNPSYRKNHTPLRDLSGAVMQVEKYIYYLNRNSVNSEKVLKDNLKEKTREDIDIDIHISNPRAMLIMGRSEDFSSSQSEDFELIKRKYRNVVDIITYDDLLSRLQRLIEYFQRKAPNEKPTNN